jgi:CBS domain-containing protein
MRRIATVMSWPVETIEAETSLCQAYDLMQQHGVKHLPVVREQRLVGLVTAHHLHSIAPDARGAQAQLSPSTASTQWRVCDVMTTDVITLHPDTPAQEAARLAWEHDIGCFVIVDGHQLLGIVTTTDLLDLFIDRLEANYPNRYRHLLVATDFSAAAAQAMPTAMSLVRRHQAKLTLIHVLPHLTRFFTTDIGHTSAETVAMLVDAGREEALARLEGLVSSDLGRVSYFVAHGAPSTAIVNTAIATQADLIVMGQRQHRRPYGLRRGITRRVIKHAPCPILLVQTEVHYELVKP